MKFRGHETFFIRKGWLNKGLRNVERDPFVFRGRNENPMDALGIGSNMVKSLRYWLQAVGLTEEPAGGKRGQIISGLGQIVFDNDPYTEEIGTLCLIHYNLVTNIEDATAWYYFFNEFSLMEFTRNDFLVQIKNYIRLQDEEVSDRSLEDDFNCIISTYIPRWKSNPEKVLPESNIDCPMGELGLIDYINKKNKVYKKSTINKNDLPPLIALAIIINNADGKKEIKISAIQNERGNIGKIFNLDIISLTNLLYKLELLGYIKVVRTAGLDVISIITNMNYLDCVRQYYISLND